MSAKLKFHTGPTMQMQHDEDPRQLLLDKLGASVKDVEVLHHYVLLATYIRPEKTKGGILIPQETQKEDTYQGKTGLIIKLGPTSFVDDGQAKFPVKCAVGDWVSFRVSDGWQLTINGHPCRLLEDTHIKMRVASPDAIY